MTCVTLLIQHDLHQVNGLASQLAKDYSTPVDKTMPFSYPREHSSSGIELISQITKAHKQMYIKQFTHYNQYSYPKLYKNMSDKE